MHRNNHSFNQRTSFALAIAALTFFTGCESASLTDRLPRDPASGSAAYLPSSLEKVEPAASKPAPPASAQPQYFAIDLPTALKLAEGQNQLVQLMNERINEANARLDQAELLLLPDLRLSAGYQHHEGRIQSTNGTVIDSSRSSAFAGPGLTLNLNIADAIYQPLVAKQDTAAAIAASRALTNRVLLDVVHTYYELLRAKLNLAIANETVENATDLAELTTNFLKSGAGLKSDAERAAVEQLLAKQTRGQATQTFNIHSAQLAQLLHLDPTVRLDPIDTAASIINIVPAKTPLTELIETAHIQRPEVDQNIAQVEAGYQRYKQAKQEPWIPNLTAGVSAGAFGGGTGSSLDSSSDRSDYAVGIYWQLDNLGLGAKANTRLKRSRLQQLRINKANTIDQISSEVAQAFAQTQSTPHQIKLGAAAVKRAAESYKLNRSRIHEKQGLPIEVLQAIHSLSTTRNAYLDSVISHNQAQFQLYTAIGHPSLEFETK